MSNPFKPYMELSHAWKKTYYDKNDNIIDCDKCDEEEIWYYTYPPLILTCCDDHKPYPKGPVTKIVYESSSKDKKSITPVFCEEGCQKKWGKYHECIHIKNK